MFGFGKVPTDTYLALAQLPIRPRASLCAFRTGDITPRLVQAGWGEEKISKLQIPVDDFVAVEVRGGGDDLLTVEGRGR